MRFKKLLSLVLAGSMFVTSSITGFASDYATDEASFESSLVEFTSADDYAADASSFENSTDNSSDILSEDEDILIIDDSAAEDTVSDDESDKDDGTAETDSLVEDIELEEEAAEAASSEASLEFDDTQKFEENTDEQVVEEELIDFSKYAKGYNLGEEGIEIIQDDPIRLFRSSGSSYNSKQITKLLPPLRNQNPYGTCWAFATTALVEINLLKKGLVSDVDLSELHLAYFAYNSVLDPLGGTEGDYEINTSSGLLDEGGTYERAFAALGQWMGSADELTAQYDRDAGIANTTGLQDAIAYEDYAHIQDYYLAKVNIGEFRSTGKLSLLDPVKQLVDECGAAGLVFLAYSGTSSTTGAGTYNSKNNCYYNPNYSGNGHAVAIVGWDDDFPKEKFSITPKGDGAFLIRNSWMTEEDGDTNSYAGYFWMSYYDATIQNTFYGVNAVLADDYDNNYQYDGGYTTRYHTEKTGANVFTAHAEDGVAGEQLKAVSFYTNYSNTGYTIEIYKDVKDTPDSGILCDELTVSGTVDFAGVHTVKLGDGVYLEPGSKFAVVVKLDKQGLVREYAYESAYDGLASRDGESFSYSDSTNTWSDVGTVGNYKIKAYTVNVEGDDRTPKGIVFENVEEDKLTLNVDEAYKVIAKVEPAGATGRNITWSSSDEKVATVTSGGQIIPIAAGNTVITASVLNGAVSHSINLTVVNGLLSISVKCYQVFDFMNGESYIQYKATYAPKSYVPTEKVVWTSSDEDVVSIDANGRITEKMMGQSVITASLAGKSVADIFTVVPSTEYFDYEVSDDKVVTLKWDAAKNAQSYRIYREGDYTATIKDDGSSSYEYVDDYYKGSDQQSTYYYFGTNYTQLYRFNVVLSAGFNITYVLNGGIQNPNNPTMYKPGKEVKLLPPTPPEGYDFDGWYTDAACKNYKNKIYTYDTGDVTFYAKYRPGAPKLNVDRNSITMAPGSETTVTAAYSPASGSDRYTWTTSNAKIVKVTANGSTATITAGDTLGSATVTVKCNGLTKVIPVSVQKIIWLDKSSLSIKVKEGASGHITSYVSDEYAGTPIIWESADETIATVTADGTVYPADGLTEQKEVEITATISGTEYSASCMVTVIPTSAAKAPNGAVNGKAVDEGTSRVNKGSLFALSSDTDNATIYYALGGAEPSVDANGVAGSSTYKYNEAIKINEATTVKAIVYKAGSLVSDVRTYSFTIVNDNWGDVASSLRADLFGGDSNNVPDSVWYIFGNEADGYVQNVYTDSGRIQYNRPYTGTAITMSDDISVYHGTRKLVEGRDYTLSYKNNTAAATSDAAKAPTVMVKGKGSYASTATFTFNIDKISIDNAEISTETVVPVIAGKNVKLGNTKPTVKFAGKALRLGTDYVLGYYDSEGAPVADPAKTLLTDAGKTYVITVSATDKSNFVGTMTQTVTVKTQNQAKTVMATKLKVTDPKGRAFKLNYNSAEADLEAIFDNNGEGKEPQAVIKNGKDTLIYGVDYEIEKVSGYDYKSAGKHKYIIKGIAKDDPDLISYVGNKTETLEITGVALNKAKFAGFNTAVEFTGKAITLEDLFNSKDKTVQKEGWSAVTLYTYNAQTKQNVPLTMSTDGVNGDYTVRIAQKTYPGKVDVEFIGINGYTGTVKKSVTIKAFNVATNAGGKLEIEASDAVYTKSGARPEVSVRFIVERNADGTVKTALDLHEGIDYTLTYKNNTKIADKSAKAAPAVTVKGIGNYTGSNATRTYTITKAPITSAYLVAADVRYNAKGKSGYALVVPKIYQDDKALTIGKGKDIEAFNKADIEYTYAANTVLGDANGTQRYDGEKVLPTDAVLPGTVIRVSIRTSKLVCSDKSSFMHEVSENASSVVCGYYRVIDPANSISKYNVQLRDPNQSFYNNANEIMLKESDLVVYRTVNKVREELDVSDYKIKSVKNNKFIGNATVVLEGRGNYNGTKTVTIRIAAKKVASK